MKPLHKLLALPIGFALLTPCLADTPPVSALAPVARAPVQAATPKPSSPLSIVDRVALNPQPLPPSPPDPDRVRATRRVAPQKSASAAQKSGIIIIGGAPAKH